MVFNDKVQDTIHIQLLSFMKAFYMIMCTYLNQIQEPRK